MLTRRLAGGNWLLVNVKDQVETQGCHLSRWLFRGSVNKVVVGDLVDPNCVGSLTLREEVGFHSSSDAMDTHYPGMQGGLKPFMHTTEDAQVLQGFWASKELSQEGGTVYSYTCFL